MSRIGKQPVVYPASVKVHLADGKIRVEGPKGKLELTPHQAMIVKHDDKDPRILACLDEDEAKIRALLSR